MDTTKWKSIAVEVQIYEYLKQRAQQNDRSVSKELTHILKEKRAQEAA
jgi:macrodomain Ter protein organizer (MatP/YcbG family)